MKSKKRFISVTMASLMVFGLSSCKNIKGDFEAYQTIDVMNKKFLAKTKVASIDPGNYQAKVTVKSKKATVQLNRKQDGKSQKFKFDIKLPKEITQEKFEGDFTVDAAENLQDFGLKGNVFNEHGQGSPYFDSDSCIHHYVTEEVCHTIEDRSDDHSRGRGDRGHGYREVCHTEQVPIYGSELCEKYQVWGDKNIRVEFLDQKTRLSAGRLNASMSLYRNTVTISCGPCEL